MSISVPRERLQDGITAIRPLESSDLPALVEARIRNREFLTEWEPTRDESFFTPAGQARELALDDAAWRTATGFPFAILDAEDGRPADRARRAGERRARASGRTRRSATGSARTPAAAGTPRGRWGSSLRFAFEVAGLHRVQPAIMPRNIRSRRVVEKCGFRQEGVAARYLRINGAWEDHLLYAMTVEDWRDLHPE